MSDSASAPINAALVDADPAIAALIAQEQNLSLIHI